MPYEILHSDINTAVSYGQEPFVQIQGPSGERSLYLDSIEGSNKVLKGLQAAYEAAKEAYDEAADDEEQFAAGNVVLEFLDGLSQSEIKALYKAA